MLTIRSSTGCVVRPRASRPCVARSSRAVVRSTPKDVDAQLEKAIKSAENCTDDCAAQWDTVEELAAAKSHLKDAIKADPTLTDPLEMFCKENADADECRVYED